MHGLFISTVLHHMTMDIFWVFDGLDHASFTLHRVLRATCKQLLFDCVEMRLISARVHCQCICQHSCIYLICLHSWVYLLHGSDGRFISPTLMCGNLWISYGWHWKHSMLHPLSTLQTIQCMIDYYCWVCRNVPFVTDSELYMYLVTMSLIAWRQLVSSAVRRPVERIIAYRPRFVGVRVIGVAAVGFAFRIAEVFDFLLRTAVSVSLCF